MWGYLAICDQAEYLWGRRALQKQTNFKQLYMFYVIIIYIYILYLISWGYIYIYKYMYTHTIYNIYIYRFIHTQKSWWLTYSSGDRLQQGIYCWKSCWQNLGCQTKSMWINYLVLVWVIVPLRQNKNSDALGFQMSYEYHMYINQSKNIWKTKDDMYMVQRNFSYCK